MDVPVASGAEDEAVRAPEVDQRVRAELGALAHRGVRVDQLASLVQPLRNHLQPGPIGALDLGERGRRLWVIGTRGNAARHAGQPLLLDGDAMPVRRRHVEDPGPVGKQARPGRARGLWPVDDVQPLRAAGDALARVRVDQRRDGDLADLVLDRAAVVRECPLEHLQQRLRAPLSVNAAGACNARLLLLRPSGRPRGQVGGRRHARTAEDGAVRPGDPPVARQPSEHGLRARSLAHLQEPAAVLHLAGLGHALQGLPGRAPDACAAQPVQLRPHLGRRRVPQGPRAVRVVHLTPAREQLADQHPERRHRARELAVQGPAGQQIGPLQEAVVRRRRRLRRE
mmetsp:Transcript_78272/g.211768  ORF Transcript_78272/g.211768 Transcript_78272/m.211768 type:complete len:340 (+) Transcript_78272:1089-2108(+)